MTDGDREHTVDNFRAVCYVAEGEVLARELSASRPWAPVAEDPSGRR